MSTSSSLSESYSEAAGSLEELPQRASLAVFLGGALALRSAMTASPCQSLAPVVAPSECAAGASRVPRVRCAVVPCRGVSRREYGWGRESSRGRGALWGVSRHRRSRMRGARLRGSRLLTGSLRGCSRRQHVRKERISLDICGFGERPVWRDDVVELRKGVPLHRRHRGNLRRPLLDPGRTRGDDAGEYPNKFLDAKVTLV